MSLFNALSWSSLEATAAVLLLDSDDIDDIVIENIEKLKTNLKEAKEQKRSCAFRITKEDKNTTGSSHHEPKKLKTENRDDITERDPKIKGNYGYWLTATRIQTFAENLHLNIPLSDYKSHFGLSAVQVEKLLKLIAPYYVQSEKQKNLDGFVLSGLATLATQKSFREIGFEMCRSKGHVCVWSQRFNALLADNFTHLIKWPKEKSFNYIESKFKDICGFPGVVGAFGACHIPLKYASKSTDTNFKNNKGFYSLVLSATCDPEMNFTSLSIDTPINFQSTNGMSSQTIQALVTNPQSLIKNDFHILTGSGFPLCNQILTPFLSSESTLTKEQLIYNKKLEETRKVILQTFTLLRKRFQRLYVVDVMDFNRAAACIVAACILHNFAMKDEDLDDLDEDIPLELEEVLQIDSNDDPLCKKRDNIAKSFFRS